MEDCHRIDKLFLYVCNSGYKATEGLDNGELAKLNRL